MTTVATFTSDQGNFRVDMDGGYAAFFHDDMLVEEGETPSIMDAFAGLVGGTYFAGLRCGCGNFYDECDFPNCDMVACCGQPDGCPRYPECGI